MMTAGTTLRVDLRPLLLRGGYRETSDFEIRECIADKWKGHARSNMSRSVFSKTDHVFVTPSGRVRREKVVLGEGVDDPPEHDDPRRLRHDPPPHAPRRRGIPRSETSQSGIPRLVGHHAP
jgi:hypothetical protein